MNPTSIPNTTSATADTPTDPLQTAQTTADATHTEQTKSTIPPKTDWFPDPISQVPGGESAPVADQHLNLGGKILMAGVMGALGYGVYRLFGKKE